MLSIYYWRYIELVSRREKFRNTVINRDTKGKNISNTECHDILYY